MKTDPRNRTICVKVTATMLAHIRECAQEDGVTVSDWLYRMLRAELYGRVAHVRQPVEPIVLHSRGPSLTVAERSEVWGRSGGKCHYCNGALDPFRFHVDHRLPVARGGTREPSNLVAACKPCNMAKGTKTADEFLAMRAA